MTDRYRDRQGVPIGGYDTPLNAPDGYATFTHTPTAAELAAYEARVVYDAAIEDATPDMPSTIAGLSARSAVSAPREMKRLGMQVQSWRALAEADAKAAILRGDYGEAAMNYAIMRAVTNDN